MKILVKGVDAEIAKLRKLFKSAEDAKSNTTANALLKALVKATPIDTGEARQGWRMILTRAGVAIENNVPYIEALNHGHSKQAPSHFIEKVALLHGKANGTIVTNTPTTKSG